MRRYQHSAIYVSYVKVKNALPSLLDGRSAEVYCFMWLHMLGARLSYPAFWNCVVVLIKLNTGSGMLRLSWYMLSIRQGAKAAQSEEGQ